jgi:hypothetical protein
LPDSAVRADLGLSLRDETASAIVGEIGFQHIISSRNGTTRNEFEVRIF